MVTSSKAQLVDTDIASWLAGLQPRWTPAQLDSVQRAYTRAAEVLAENRRGLAVAAILADLNMDHEVIVAALLYEAVNTNKLNLRIIEREFGDAVMRLLNGVAKLAMIGEFHRQGLHEDQHLERLRKMLLAMAQDIRVVLIKLALRLFKMRHLGALPETQQRRIARETLDIFAPLANRLGIGQVKWELEDLSLRYLDPVIYKSLARALDERRADRERYIAGVIEQLQTQLSQAGIRAQVSGRVKHIYSIWKKMQRKQLPFEQIFDVSAARIMVDSVTDCYAALGVVHSIWAHIRKEFDDYIANPKGNGYQSLHTAVVGPGGKTLEVQIRTSDMHRNAELGVAAHWLYKEGGSRDNALERQITWLRQMLEWKDEDGDADDFFDQFKAEIFQDRVYTVTPQGTIIDLEQGATPLDFAYRVHTEVGHRCRGARVNGRIVPLSYELKNGDQVEVLTAKNGAPSRDWLSPHLGYLKSSRARAKVRQWFKQQDQEKNVTAGRGALEQEFKRLDVDQKQVNLQKVAEKLNFTKIEELYAAIGYGNLTTGQVVSRVQELILPAPRAEFLPVTRRVREEGTGEIKIRGVGNLLTQMANCCKPVPYDAIVGFITRGRGVTIHRQDCPNLLNLSDSHQERLIEVDWGEDTQASYSVDIQVDAYDRTGLLRDITFILSNDKTNVLAANTLSDPQTGTARMALTLEISDLGQLSRILDKIGQLPNVMEARRKG